MGFEYYEPTTLSEALEVLAHEGEAGAPLAGGTDLLLQLRRGARSYRSVINIKYVPGLDGIQWDDHDGLTFGALATFRAIETDATVGSKYPALTEAARVVAGVQLRNLATIGGNLGNASPSADSVPPLVALRATATIASSDGERTLPVEQCLTGPGTTVLQPGEIFTAIHIPSPTPGQGSAYARFGPRSAMDIGIASVAVSVTVDSDGRCSNARISCGAVSPVPMRATEAEATLEGGLLTDALCGHAGELAANAVQPITDIRGTAEYRRALVEVLTKRMVQVAASRASGSDAQPS